MNIQGEKVIIKKQPQEVFNYFIDFSNFKNIMPENISKFESSNDGFSFALTGMPEIGLKLKEKDPFNKIILTSVKESIDFSLELNISQNEESFSEVFFNFNGSFNPFIKMMVEKPLNNFIKSLTENLNKI